MEGERLLFQSVGQYLASKERKLQLERESGAMFHVEQCKVVKTVGVMHD